MRADAWRRVPHVRRTAACIDRLPTGYHACATRSAPPACHPPPGASYNAGLEVLQISSGWRTMHGARPDGRNPARPTPFTIRFHPAPPSLPPP